MGRKKAGKRRTPGGQRRRRRPGPGRFARFLIKAGIAVAFVLAGFLTVAVVDVNWRFTHRENPTPIRIFSAPLNLAKGVIMPRDDLRERLRRLGYRQVNGHPATPGEYGRRQGTFTIFLNAFDYPGEPLEAVPLRVRISSGVVRRVNDFETGERLASARLEPELLGVLSGNVHEERIPLDLDEFPQSLLDAVIAVEDRRFYRHTGIDPRGVLRALLANIRSGEVVQGGSTITQQLAKNLYPGNNVRTFTLKIWESLAALGLEAFRSKRDILERYLNEIYLAQRGPFAILGMGAASRHYFGKDPGYLDLAESAFLAGLIQSPGRYQPYRHPEVARRRRNLVLKLMRAEGFIDALQFKEASEAPLGVRPEPSQQPRHAPYFIDYVAQELDRLISRSPRQRRGLRVFTTLDPLLQARAEAVLNKRLDGYERDFPHLNRSDGEELQGALVALRPEDGSLLAMVGGRNYGRSQFNRVAQAHRQPGSLFKPFVFLTGFRNAEIAGEPSFTAATVLEDSPLVMQVGGKQWKPGNVDGEFRGPVSAREALAMSLNVPTIRAAEAIGLKEIVRTARRCGIVSPMRPVPSLALGTFEVTPLELASAFTTFANLGVRSVPRVIDAIGSPAGHALTIPEPELRGATSPEAAYLTLDLMRDVLRYGTGARVRSYDIDGDFAGKTGTTDDGRDAWFVGFTPDYLALAWVGFDDNRPLRLGGSTLALPIWASLAERAPIDPDAYWEAPEGVVVERIDPLTGQLAGWRCTDSVREVFIEGTQPTEICELHQNSRPESWARRLFHWFKKD